MQASSLAAVSCESQSAPVHRWTVDEVLALYETETGRERLMPVEEVVAAAKAAKDKGASRFCMGAAWKGPKDNDLDRVLEMVREVKALGMQTCVTLGMLKDGQAEKLKDAGLDRSEER